MNKLNVALGLSLAALCALPSSSQAQDVGGRGDGFRLHLGLGLGVGGEATAEFDTPIGEQEASSDLKTTVGPRLGIEVPLHTYFTLGGELGLAFWQTEAGDDADRDRQLSVDVLARPKLRLPVANGFEAYAVLPIGYSHYVARDAPDSFEGGPGFAVGGLAGASYFFTQSLGATAELGYMYRKFSSTVDVLGTSTDASNSFGQFQVNLGLALAF